MKAKLLTAAALTLAGLGLACNHKPSAPGALHPQTATPSVEPVRDDDGGAVVPTPSVAKLLPKAKPAGPVDGERSADGYFEYESARNIYVPVDFGHPRYTHGGQRVGLEHLIAEHGHARSSAGEWTQNELEVAHANSHYWEKTHGATRQVAAPASSFTSACPNGNCGNTKMGRGLFGRRR
jgi:hypothetical protein